MKNFLKKKDLEKGDSEITLNSKVVHKQRGKPGEMGKAVAIPPDKEAEKKEMFKVSLVFSLTLKDTLFPMGKKPHTVRMTSNVITGEPIQPDGQRDDQSEQELARCQAVCL